MVLETAVYSQKEASFVKVEFWKGKCAFDLNPGILTLTV